MIDWVVNAFQNLKKSNLDSFSGGSLIPSDRDNFLSFSKYSSPFSYVLTMSGCDIQFVLVEKNMSHLLLWRDILTGEVGKQGLYPGSSLVKRSQTWDLSMCPFFVAPSHKGPCPLKEILLSFIRFIIYAFIPSSYMLVCTIYIYWLIHEGIQVQDIHRALYQLTPHQMHVPSNLNDIGLIK